MWEKSLQSYFDVGEVVTVVLTTEIQSSQGVPLDCSYIWSFTIIAYNESATFPSHTDYPAGNYTHSVFAADLDGDNDLDLATANILSYDDLDGDGDLDLAAANGYSNSVSVLLNNGNGTFATQSMYTVGAGPVEVYGADLDGDGDIDLYSGNFDVYPFK